MGSNAEQDAARDTAREAEPGTEADDVPGWFWEVLAATRPRLTALESWLGSRPREVLEEFALAHECAAESLADYADGVCVDGDGWSEDDTEDLCAWVVAQGHGFWEAVRTGRLRLDEAARLYLGRTPPPPGHPAPWDDEVADPRHRGYRSPAAIVHGVYRTRFAEELHERLGHH
ncbi:hypothetical protein ACFCX4_19740 [Kitasatospora sp. NPDC056327]|uniref:hypothetical protein n=1 Tax=Kitasatospora sp. NPDC056327 TaxID=3345785 RepID=UPI0035DE7EDF